MSACNDWHCSRREILRDGATQMVPIPAEAVEQGIAAFARDGGLTRRNILAGGVGLMAACVAGGPLSPRALLENAAAAADPAGKILVLIHQDGGNDGLNTLIPLTDPRYRELRTRIGIPAASALALPDTGQFGWHPSLGGLKRLYDLRKVAVLPSVDFANPDQSHFNSAAYWRSGIVGRAPDRTGWLGRTMDILGTADNPLQAISATWGLDPVLLSKRAAVANIPDPDNFGFWIRDVWRDSSFLPLYRTMSSGARRPGLRSAQQAYANAISVRERLESIRVPDDQKPLTPKPYPDTGLGKSLRNLARMLNAGFGTRVATVSSGGGYDTHSDQPEEHAKLLTDLGDSLEAWQADLESRGLGDRVLTMVWSEFGRRAEDNESNGTDHGAGGLVLLVGNGVKGGIRTEWPGLSRLDEDGNLLVTTEFRSVYATILEQWMGVEAGRVLPGIDNRRVDVLGAV